MPEEIVEKKNINLVEKSDVVLQTYEPDFEVISTEENPEQKKCNHRVHHICCKLSPESNLQYCALFDTGAQVSLLNEESYLQMKRENPCIKLDPCGESLVGLGNQEEKILGLVKICVHLYGMTVKTMPFAVVEKGAIPCCMILGANFIVENSIELDFGKNMVALNKDQTVKRYSINSAFVTSNDTYKFDIRH